ncbi:DUF3883 domain-containing protein [Gordonia aquimaris]|uniref:DUF3883 domain-containing protein n=1 Tax=Gordonia aquimaris TaxID=2984863 RepID=A0A9X3D9U6_9ACTN|nr:DUF3883 domain-containing protein [Gordonia aquimaris]MCX2966277.1 DUF3883 domain-containing protein [Gordonia aquimaris]
MINRAVTEDNLGAWVFKCNPDVYDLPAEIADGESFVEGWSVTDNYRSQMITAGQKAILWMSGDRNGYAPRGIWGIGWTTGDSYEVDGLSGGYWQDDDHAARVRHMVPTAIRILDEPDRLRADDVAVVPDLADLEVFTVPQGSNPSWISRAQLAALEPLLPPWPAPNDVPLTTVTLGPHGAAFGSPENNTLVEQAAMDAVTKYYETHWQAEVDDVHTYNMGWDLTVTTPAGEEWHVEVKGVSGSLPIVLLTANECRVAEHEDAWELAVVTHALSDEPEVTVYDADQVLRNSQPQTVRADLRGEDGWST